MMEHSKTDIIAELNRQRTELLQKHDPGSIAAVELIDNMIKELSRTGCCDGVQSRESD